MVGVLNPGKACRNLVDVQAKVHVELMCATIIAINEWESGKEWHAHVEAQLEAGGFEVYAVPPNMAFAVKKWRYRVFNTGTVAVPYEYEAFAASGNGSQGRIGLISVEDRAFVGKPGARWTLATTYPRGLERDDFRYQRYMLSCYGVLENVASWGYPPVIAVAATFDVAYWDVLACVRKVKFRDGPEVRCWDFWYHNAVKSLRTLVSGEAQLPRTNDGMLILPHGGPVYAHRTFPVTRGLVSGPFARAGRPLGVHNFVEAVLHPPDYDRLLYRVDSPQQYSVSQLAAEEEVWETELLPLEQLEERLAQQVGVPVSVIREHPEQIRRSASLLRENPERVVIQ